VRQVSALFEQVDVIVTPTTGMQLVATNLTGHPALILPNGLRGDDAPKPPKVDDGDSDDIGGPGTPVSLTFLAGHFQEAKLAAFAQAYQEATGFIRRIRSWIEGQRGLPPIRKSGEWMGHPVPGYRPKSENGKARG